MLSNKNNAFSGSMGEACQAFLRLFMIYQLINQQHLPTQYCSLLIKNLRIRFNWGSALSVHILSESFKTDDVAATILYLLNILQPEDVLIILDAPNCTVSFVDFSQLLCALNSFKAGLYVAKYQWYMRRDTRCPTKELLDMMAIFEQDFATASVLDPLIMRLCGL